ncbi:MAG: hypothetical protein FJ121_08985 [Deltaproteobacteria bacterium]|nr:hypothetical protein [Deltaproteobacteria bacterium]
MGKPIIFGAGNLYGISRGVLVPTPVKFGILQEVGVEVALTKKELIGQKVFPDAVGVSEGKITCKAKLARLSADLMGGLFFGATPATGQVVPVVGETGTIPATPGPYTITVANGATFHTNLGVVFRKNNLATDGQPLTRVSGAPATGEYSLVEATGTYTYAAADQGKLLKFDYLYTSTLVGKTITIVNPEAGTTPTFKAILIGNFDGEKVTLILNRCVSDKLTLPTKRGDFTIQEMDFSAQADDDDALGLLSLGS